jgi:hypothetical protein
MWKLPRLSQAYNCRKFIARTACCAALLGFVTLNLDMSLAYARSDDKPGSPLSPSVLKLIGEEKNISNKNNMLCDQIRGDLAEDFRNSVYEPSVTQFHESHRKDLVEQVQWINRIYKVDVSEQNGEISFKIYDPNAPTGPSGNKAVSLHELVNELVNGFTVGCSQYDDTTDSVYRLEEAPNDNRAILAELHHAQAQVGEALAAPHSDENGIEASGPAMVGKLHKPILTQAAGSQSEADNGISTSGAMLH